MVRPRTGDKEQALIDAAIELFLERGVRGSTIQQIAARAQVAVGTVYIYYKDKTAIVQRVALAFAERHADFAREVLASRRKPLAKLNAYILGFYDMWQPFGENSKGPVELAAAILKSAPEAVERAEAQFQSTVEQILVEAREEGLRVERPAEEARWLALSTAAFFPLAGTPTVHPLSTGRSREDLAGLLKWLGRKLS